MFGEKSNSIYKFFFREFTELGAVVCYGFLVLILAFYWPNEANAHLVLFCLSNGILALVTTLKPKGDSELCRWNGLLSKLNLWNGSVTWAWCNFLFKNTFNFSIALLALTLGFDSLYRSQIERKRLAEHQFRLYHKRPIFKRIGKSFVFAVLASFIAWNLYRDNPSFKM